MKLLRNVALSLISLLCLYGTTLASSMKFFPSTGTFGLYCINSGEIRVNTAPDGVSAIDARIFSTDVNFISFSGLLSFGNFTHLGSLGHSLMTVNYARQSYASNSSYRYINRYASNADTLLNTSETGLFSYLFASTGLNLTGNLDLYYVAGENFDDSNMQSSIINGMTDILDDVNSGSYTFLPTPCIVDTDPPVFTGYVSGASYSGASSGFYFTIMDYTGNRIVGYNTTEHYRFQSGTSDTGNLANYVAVGANDIDNQEGVNSGSITVYLSGIVEITSGSLLAPVTFALADLDCSYSYSGPGYPLTRDRNTRGYTCFVPFVGLTFGTNQIVQVVITGADTLFQTGSIGFTFSMISSGTFFDIKAYPGSRPGGNFSNIGTLKFYNQSKALVLTSSVATDSSGLALLQIDGLPSDTYYVVYKGQSHLASYLSGISTTVGGLFYLDFTTGTNLYNTQNQSISQNDGYQRQIAGDLLSTDNKYDYTVNGNDIAILTMSGFIDLGIGVLDPKNLNADEAINVSDISVIGVNFQLKDPFHSTYSGTKFIF